MLIQRLCVAVLGYNMTEKQKIDLKLKIISEFKGLKYTLVEMYSIFDDLKTQISNLVIEQELKKMKFRRI